MSKKTFDVEMQNWWHILLKDDHFQQLVREAREKFGIPLEGVKSFGAQHKWKSRKLNAVIHKRELFKELSDFYAELENLAVNIIGSIPADSRGFRRALLHYFETGQIDRRFLNVDAFITNSTDIYLNHLSHIEHLGRFNDEAERIFVEIGPNASNTTICKFIRAKKKEIELLQEELRRVQGIEKKRKSPVSPLAVRDAHIRSLNEKSTPELRAITRERGRITRNRLIAIAMEQLYGERVSSETVNRVLYRKK